MSDQQNNIMDQNEFMKRMKAIASDLWGGNTRGRIRRAAEASGEGTGKTRNRYPESLEDRG